MRAPIRASATIVGARVTASYFGVFLFGRFDSQLQMNCYVMRAPNTLTVLSVPNGEAEHKNRTKEIKN